MGVDVRSTDSDIDFVRVNEGVRLLIEYTTFICTNIEEFDEESDDWKMRIREGILILTCAQEYAGGIKMLTKIAKERFDERGEKAILLWLNITEEALGSKEMKKMFNKE